MTDDDRKHVAALVRDHLARQRMSREQFAFKTRLGKSCDRTDRLQEHSRQKLKPIQIRQSAYLNNRIEQDHRAIKRRVRSMLGFKSIDSARAIIGGIELVHMMRKGQAKYAWNPSLSLAEQFERLTA